MGRQLLEEATCLGDQEVDMKMVVHWSSKDELGFVQQLGVILGA